MPKFLVTIHHPDDFKSSSEGQDRIDAIDQLNKEMVEAGVRYVVGGLGPLDTAKSLTSQTNGEILITDGPYLETKEHVGGFWIVDVADLDEALTWGQKAVVACGTPVEVRPFYGNRTEAHAAAQSKQG